MGGAGGQWKGGGRGEARHIVHYSMSSYGCVKLTSIIASATHEAFVLNVVETNCRVILPTAV